MSVFFSFSLSTLQTQPRGEKNVTDMDQSANGIRFFSVFVTSIRKLPPTLAGQCLGLCLGLCGRGARSTAAAASCGLALQLLGQDRDGVLQLLHLRVGIVLFAFEILCQEGENMKRLSDEEKKRRVMKKRRHDERNDRCILNLHFQRQALDVLEQQLIASAADAIGQMETES